jgi:hypothetical protein
MKINRVNKEDQSWFWTKRWQQGEREADEDIKAGRVYEFPNTESAITSLKTQLDIKSSLKE